MALRKHFFIPAKGQTYKGWYLHLPEASNFLIYHLSEPEALPQHTACLQTSNDPFSQTSQSLPGNLLMLLVNALMSHCAITLGVSGHLMSPRALRLFVPFPRFPQATGAMETICPSVSEGMAVLVVAVVGLWPQESGLGFLEGHPLEAPTLTTHWCLEVNSVPPGQ